MPITMEYQNAVYTFSRDHLGNGGWVCIKGRCQGTVGFLTSQLYVHAELNTELTREAISLGLGSISDFARATKKEKPEPIRRISRPKRRSRGGVIGGLNLGSLFDTGHDELSMAEKPRKVTYEEI